MTNLPKPLIMFLRGRHLPFHGINVYLAENKPDEDLFCSFLFYIWLFKSDFRYVADFFVQLRKTGNPHLSGTEIKHVDELLKTISALTGDRRFEDEMNQEIVRKDGGIMRLEFLDRAEERGEKRGEELKEISLILRNYLNGMSPDMITDFMGDYVYVASVIETIRNLPAGCTVDDIYKEMHGVTEER